MAVPDLEDRISKVIRMARKDSDMVKRSLKVMFHNPDLQFK